MQHEPRPPDGRDDDISPVDATFRLPGGIPIAWAVLGIPFVAIGLVSLLVLGKGGGPAGASTSQPTRVATAALVFDDRPDGAVEVRRQSDRTLVIRLAPATNAFVRVVLSGLVRERRREGQGDPSRPFTVTRWSDGRLTLDDTATQRLVELSSFGPDNQRAFEVLLDTAVRGAEGPSTDPAAPASRGR